MKREYKEIIKILGKNKVRINEPMENHTTFKIGGPADLYYEAKTNQDLVKVIKSVSKLSVPYFILGNGSNLLVGDKGYRGMVIKNLVSGAKVIRKLKKPIKFEKIKGVPYKAADPKKYLNVIGLDYPDERLDTEVEVQAGTSLQSFIRWSFKQKLAGLQWFAGIPASVGGAVIHNAHGFTRLFSSYISELRVLDKRGIVRSVKASEIDFGYGFSNIQQKYLALLSIRLLLSSQNTAQAKATYEEWRQRKLVIQPQTNCPGSYFKNISEDLAKKIGAPTPSAGWLIDQCGLKRVKIGKVQVSEKHANFIVNFDGAKAADVVKLVTLIKKKVKEKFGIDLEEEVVRIGEF